MRTYSQHFPIQNLPAGGKTRKEKEFRAACLRKRSEKRICRAGGHEGKMQEGRAEPPAGSLERQPFSDTSAPH